MIRVAVLLALLGWPSGQAAASEAADGGSIPPPSASRWDHPLYALCPKAPPPVVLPDGSRVITPLRTARLDCIMVTAHERVLQLEQAPPAFGLASRLLAGIALGLGLLSGFLGGWYLRGLLP